MPIKTEVVIIGGGPAGLTAAIYTARANLKPIVAMGASNPGGQLIQTTDIENFPGVGKMEGFQLIENMKNQALEFGAELIQEDATNFDFSKQGGPFRLKIGKEDYITSSIIIATGASANWLHAKREDEFINRGISSCATCDGPLRVFRNKEIAVVGAGDSACEEALFLSKFGSKIYMYVRSDKMRASKIMRARVEANEKIEVVFNTEIQSYEGDSFLTHINLINNKTNEKYQKKIGGVFMGIGHTPSTQQFLHSELELTEKNYIRVRDNVFTNIEGVFAAGDVQDDVFRQAITASGFGAMAAISCEKWLESKKSSMDQ